MGCGDVMRVRGVGITCKLGVDVRAACAGMLFGLQNQRTAALTDDEAVTISVERTAGLFGVIVAARQGVRLGQTGDHDRTQNGLTADREHRVGFAGAQQHGSGHNRVTACRTSGIERHARAGDAVGDGNLRGGNVADGHGHKARADALARVIGGLRACDCGHAVHGRAHDDADPVGVCCDVQTAVAQRFLGRDKRILHERVHGAREGLGHVGGRVEVLELGCNLYGQVGCVKAGDAADAALARGQRLPIGRNAHPDRGDRAHAGNYKFCLIQMVHHLS